jgi:hypothetical protein
MKPEAPNPEGFEQRVQLPLDDQVLIQGVPFFVANTKFTRLGRHVDRYSRRWRASFCEMANCRIEFTVFGV